VITTLNATILNVLKETIEDVKHMRVIEGKKIEEILKTLIEEISSINKYIKNNAQKLPEITYEKLKKRLESFMLIWMRDA